MVIDSFEKGRSLIIFFVFLESCVYKSVSELHSLFNGLNSEELLIPKISLQIRAFQPRDIQSHGQFEIYWNGDSIVMCDAIGEIKTKHLCEMKRDN
jgi:hypothetical protein